MRIILFSFLCLCLLGSCNKEQLSTSKDEGLPIERVQTKNLVPAVAAGLADRRNCLSSKGNCGWAVYEEGTISVSHQWPVGLSVVADNKLMISNLGSDNSEDGDLIIPSSLYLPSNLAASLGATSVQILSGTYVYDYTSNSDGDVIVDVVITW